MVMVLKYTILNLYSLVLFVFDSLSLFTPSLRYRSHPTCQCWFPPTLVAPPFVGVEEVGELVLFPACLLLGVLAASIVGIPPGSNITPALNVVV